MSTKDGMSSTIQVLSVNSMPLSNCLPTNGLMDTNGQSPHLSTAGKSYANLQQANLQNFHSCLQQQNLPMQRQEACVQDSSVPQSQQSESTLAQAQQQLQPANPPMQHSEIITHQLQSMQNSDSETQHQNTVLQHAHPPYQHSDQHIQQPHDPLPQYHLSMEVLDQPIPDVRPDTDQPIPQPANSIVQSPSHQHMLHEAQEVTLQQSSQYINQEHHRHQHTMHGQHIQQQPLQEPLISQMPQIPEVPQVSQPAMNQPEQQYASSQVAQQHSLSEEAIVAGQPLPSPQLVQQEDLPTQPSQPSAQLSNTDDQSSVAFMHTSNDRASASPGINDQATNGTIFGKLYNVKYNLVCSQFICNSKLANL